MAITKTNFINYVRCPRYVALDKIHKDKLEADVSLEDYRKEEIELYKLEVLGSMFDENGEDLIIEENPQLEVMMPYYKDVELLAGLYVENLFGVKAKYSGETIDQESFDFNSNGIKYLCYVDIYVPTADVFNIVEVKATTSNKFLKMGGTVNKEFKPLFKKDAQGIYVVDYNNGQPEKKIGEQLAKLYDRYDKCGHYVYDLAVQRYIIENDLKQNNQADKIDKIKYYLAVLNHEYVFDGTYENGKPVYGDDIIVLFDMTDITKNMMAKLENDRNRVEEYVLESKINPCPLGVFCEYKKNTKCQYAKECYKILPKENSILNYMRVNNAFEADVYDLINQGMVKMLDVPYSYLSKARNQIQRDVVETNVPYIDKEKIRDGLKEIEYPIYHLDFESFNSPLPRYRGEKCYSQSVFQFSLHIEREPGVCDKETDHYEFLAKDHNDAREELVEAMCNWIGDKGTVLVYNQSFEKSRIKELAIIFPEYKEKLDKINDMIFDLLFVIDSNKKLYTKLNYSEEKAGMFNYYHPKLNGSFSIKKVLPVFSDLTYQGMEVGNGIEAMAVYGRFPKMDKGEFKKQYEALLKYCKQDTWAMVEILKALRSLT